MLWCDLYAYKHPRKYECLHRRETLGSCLKNRWGFDSTDVTIYGFQCKSVHTFDIDPKKDGEAITKESAHSLFLMFCGATGFDRKRVSCVVTGRGIQTIVSKLLCPDYFSAVSTLSEQLKNTAWYADQCFLNPYYLITRLPHTYDRKPRKRPFLAYTLHIAEEHDA